MVDVCVTEYHGIDISRCEGEFVAILFLAISSALQHSAIEQYAMAR